MSQYTEWRDKQISSFQTRREQAIYRFYFPAIASFLVAGVAFWAKWSKWIFVTCLMISSILLFLGDRQTKCPFCRKGAVNQDAPGNRDSFDPEICPYCSMRLKAPTK